MPKERVDGPVHHKAGKSHPEALRGMPCISQSLAPVV